MTYHWRAFNRMGGYLGEIEAPDKQAAQNQAQESWGWCQVDLVRPTWGVK